MPLLPWCIVSVGMVSLHCAHGVMMEAPTVKQSLTSAYIPVACVTSGTGFIARHRALWQQLHATIMYGMCPFRSICSAVQDICVERRATSTRFESSMAV
jgi:hypothetical protein